MRTNLSALSLLLFIWLTFTFVSLRAEGSLRAWPQNQHSSDSVQGETIPPVAPLLRQSGFECDDPLRLTPWHLRYLVGTPFVQFTREWANGNCAGWVDHLEGNDSLVIASEDIESLPDPGKAFDAVLYQQITTTVGGDYSVSVWMTSFCGGTNQPNDCPPGFYIIKMVGLDPTGGVEPAANTVIWAEDNRNWVDAVGNAVGWVNLRTAATASAEEMTVFLRMRSPMQWHGNHGLIDAISVVRAPIVSFVDLTPVVTASITGTTAITLSWVGTQTPDVLTVPGNQYALLFDLQVRPAGSPLWRSLLEGATNISQTSYQPRCSDTAYEFRIRARSEQIGDQPGVFPNHRYPGVWSAPVTIQVKNAAFPNAIPAGPHLQYLPIAQNSVAC